MSKVICDVCGTTYPDTAAQCPICNSANHSQNQTVVGEEGVQPAAGREPTKGGRFSKKNVRMRSAKPAAEPRRRSSGSDAPEEEPSSTGLVVVVILLLVAIIAVLIYIGVHFFQSNDGGDVDDTKGNSVQQTEQTDPVETGDVIVGTPCESLEIKTPEITLNAAGESFMLIVNVLPLDTTDSLTFASSDPAVATVAADGTITAVGGGTATITAQCGDITAVCTVTCNIGADATEPTVPKVELVFEWNTRWIDEDGNGDTTLSKPGETWKCYKNSLNVNPADITWTSDNPEICTIVNGIVTAVSPGTTRVRAEYNGQRFTAIVRCKWTVEKPTEPTEPVEPTEPTQPNDPTEPTTPVDPTDPVNPTDPTDPEQPTEPTEPDQGTTVTYTISHEDVTLYTNGEGLEKYFYLKLVDQDGNAVEVVWTASNECVTIEGNKITAVADGTVTVSTVHEGVTYSCTVRVHTKG